VSEGDGNIYWGKDMNILDRLRAADQALTDNNLEGAARLIKEAEGELPSLDSSERSAQIRGNLGCLMIDLGDWTGDEPLIARGTQLVQNALTAFHDARLRMMHLYNAGNGYSSLWKMRRSATWSMGRLSEDYLQAKYLYRQAIDLLKKDTSLASNELKQQLYVNYANTLDSHARIVEAIEYYDRAIALNPAMGEALGNKGMALL
jgi:tetratricopeptide (TPR) repeat protein